MIERMYDGEAIHFAFNIWDFSSAQAVMDAAGNVGQNVILQTSANIFKILPQDEMRNFVTSYARKLGIIAWLNLDHCRDEQMVRNAINKGWDSVMLDLSQGNLYKNIAAVSSLHGYAQEQKHRAYIEAEIGVLQGAEEDIESIENRIASRTDIDEFVEKAHFDALAVAFGNAHGTYRTTPQLHYDLVEYAVEKSGKPFVVHGASGLSEDAVKKLIGIKGVRKINISTDLKLAARQGYGEAENRGWFGEDGFQPSMIQQSVYEAVRDKAVEKMLMLKGDM
ncbi:MAG: class II fructose-bisphosphate aldolase [Schwartzia succinivorans]|nr:class II fructose-bisphosphate aldolase [Schwartzia succinivorans]